ncbi:LemA family protein [Chloroflexota bacterium]
MAWYFYLIIVLVVVAVLFLLFSYNGLVRFRNQMKNAWAQIDVQLKRRHDLIPNLVETAKGYMTHERETFEAITNARNIAQKAVGQGVGAQSKAEGELSGVLSKLLMVVENYPDLKANTNFLALQEELASTENKIGFSRQYYNDSVMHYNNKTQMFPTNIIAGMFGFKTGEFFEIEVAAERAVPKVSF